MEKLFTSSAFLPEFIFGSLKGSIVDYILSSYMLNMRLVRMYYWRPEIQIHCGKVYNHLDEDVKTFVHVHSQTSFGGIYHAKFVLITTDQCLRFIVMTTNITNQMVENCENDYYILDIPKSAKVRTNYTQNEMILKKYLEYMKICTKNDISDYEWEGVNAHLMVSLPGEVTHTMCWMMIHPESRSSKGRATIQTTTGQLKYDIKPLLGVQHCKFIYGESSGTMDWLMYDLNSDAYELEKAASTTPFHIKRYIIYYTQPAYEKWFIVTSANLTASAWGNAQRYCKNVELGIAWNCKG